MKILTAKPLSLLSRGMGAHVCDTARLPLCHYHCLLIRTCLGGSRIFALRSVLTHPPIELFISYYKITNNISSSVPFSHFGSQVRICRRNRGRVRPGGHLPTSPSTLHPEDETASKSLTLRRPPLPLSTLGTTHAWG